jgi:hypothetical protein
LSQITRSNGTFKEKYEIHRFERHQKTILKIRNSSKILKLQYHITDKLPINLHFSFIVHISFSTFHLHILVCKNFLCFPIYRNDFSSFKLILNFLPLIKWKNEIWLFLGLGVGTEMSDLEGNQQILNLIFHGKCGIHDIKKSWTVVKFSAKFTTEILHATFQFEHKKTTFLRFATFSS